MTAHWDQNDARDALQKHLGSVVASLPSDGIGTVGVIDETSCRKWGDHTPGVQRQYLGCVGKVDNGIVTVHIGVTKGTFQALLDADLFLPKAWSDDRLRCRAPGIPDAVRHRTKWRLAMGQLIRLSANGVRFDWLTFDEGYGGGGPVPEVPEPGGPTVRGRSAGELPRAGQGRREDSARGRAVACGRRPGWDATPDRAPDGAGLVLARGDRGRVGG